MFHKKFLIISFLVSIVLLLNIQNILACSCATRPTVLDSYENSQLVVATKLISVKKVREKEGEYDINYITSTKMVVEKVYKGKVKVGDELIFAQGGGADCIWTFDEKLIGGKYLFYLGEPSKGHHYFKDENADLLYHAVVCGRSKSLESATDDLSYLDNIEKLRGKTRISGTLESWDDGSHGFANIKVKISGKDKTYTTKTDKNGFYEIYDLPADKYLIEPNAAFGWKIDNYYLRYQRSYIGDDEIEKKLKNQVPIILQEKRHAGLDLQFAIDNAIRGKIISPTGKTMEGVCLKVIPTESDEGDYRGESACTNKSGDFELTEISRGNYVLVINSDGKIDGDEPFKTLFYPGVSDRKNAGVVFIEAGKFIDNLNIQIPKTVDLIDVSGKLIYSDGKPVVDEWIEFKPSQTDIYNENRVQTDNQGRFIIKIPNGARGNLFANQSVYDTKSKHRTVEKKCELVDMIFM